jgi:hypothetical protein
MIDRTLFLVLAILAGLSILATFISGIVCLVRYARTRKVGLLIAGLLLTFIVPGCLILLIVMLLIPMTMVVYGPPPTP